MSDKRPKVLICSDFEALYTGFGRWKLRFLKDLYKSGKFNIISAAMGMQDGNPDFMRFPWKIRGLLPTDPNIIREFQGNKEKERMASYGFYRLEQLVQEEKPDIVMGIQDSWGVMYMVDQKFFSNIPTIIYVTFDSLPLLEDTIQKAPKIKHYWAWNGFSKKEFHRLGHKHIETHYPGLELDRFYNLGAKKKKELRQKHNIKEDSFGILFVFRNQLRKLINKLIEGYSIFKQQNPQIKNTYLHLHTSLDEGWNIPKLADQYGVDKKEIYFTYKCSVTGQYFVLPYSGNKADNPNIEQKGTLGTVNIKYGVTEEELNEIFNINDFYLHPATSGAAEIPLIHAAASELIVATCNYSFGEDVIEFNQGAISLDFTFYTEFPSQFLKSNPHPFSIAKSIKKVYEMSKEERSKKEQLSRKWALDLYDAGKRNEEIIKFLEQIPPHNWDFDIKEKPKRPQIQVPQIVDARNWLKTLYNFILDMQVPDDDSGLNYWLHELDRGRTRENIENYFRQVANQDNKKINPTKLEDLVDNTGKKRFLMLCKEAGGDHINFLSLLDDWYRLYGQEYDLYIATDPKYFDIFEGIDHIHKIIPYNQQLEQEMFVIGFGNHDGLFDIFCNPYCQNQRYLNYLSPRKTSFDLELKV